MRPSLASPAGPRLRWPAALAAALAVSACETPAWSDGQKSEAYRMCRGPVALAPIDVFQGEAQALATFMCECQVEHLAARLPHARLLSPFHVEEVNSALADARADCLQRYRRSRAREDVAGATHGGSLRPASFWRP